MRAISIGAAGVLSAGLMVMAGAAPAAADGHVCTAPAQGKAFAAHASYASCLSGPEVAALARGGHTR